MGTAASRSSGGGRNSLGRSLGRNRGADSGSGNVAPAHVAASNSGGGRAATAATGSSSGSRRQQGNARVNVDTSSSSVGGAASSATTGGTAAPPSSPVRCPHCRRLLQPPAGHPRFLCPCGQVLVSPDLVPQRVRCPYCQTLLAPPPGAAVFRCPCGHHLRTPAARNATAVDPGGGRKEDIGSMVAKLLGSRGDLRWMKQTRDDNKLHWVKVISDEEEVKLMDRQNRVVENLVSRAKKLDSKGLKLRLKAMGLEGVSGVKDRNKLLDLTTHARKSLLDKSTEKELYRRLRRLNAYTGNCETKQEYVDRLIVAAWDGRAPEDAWVRSFKAAAAAAASSSSKGSKNKSKPGLVWVPATDYSLDLSASKVTNAAEIELIVGKPFMEKLSWLKKKMHLYRINWEDGHVRVRVRRSHLLVDAFNSFLKLEAKDMWRYFRFEFIGEPGVDAGGIAREFFELVTDQCFDVDFGLMQYSGGDNLAYQISPTSGIANELHLEYFRFLGRVMGKSLFDGHIVNAHLTMTIYKHMLAFPVQLKDMQDVDQQLYNNLKSVLDMDDAEQLYLDFTTAVSVFGETQIIELKPGGNDIEVTNANRKEYVNLMLRHIMLDRISTQLAQFLHGFYEVIPPALLAAFDFQELELLQCGLPNVDVDDWRRNTRYRGAFAKSKGRHPVVLMFWEVMEEATEEQRARFLQFATGTSRVPVQGFGALQGNDGNIKQFTIDSIAFEMSVFPKAHTCFNRIELPLYPNKEEMKKFVYQAIQMEIVGFGIE